MKRSRTVLLAIAIVLVILSWSQVLAASRGLTVRRFTREGIPMLYLALAGAKEAPGVLVAHGFAGSKQLMLGYGYTLAHAGYAVLLWDFGGHGANGAPLERETTLQRNIDAAYAALLEQPEVDGRHLALVGHSMGSGAVMAAGIRDPGRYAAVVAISPTGAQVTPQTPRNLLLQAGSWEGNFVANARQLLAAAGGAGDDIAGGQARRMIVVPNAEHISILFRGESHRATLDWLDKTFGRLSTGTYTDRRILWYLVHLTGWLMLLIALLSAAGRGASHAPAVVPGRRRMRWIGLVVGPLVAAGAMAGLNRFVPMSGFGGLMVGGAVGLWLLIAGAIWLGLGRGLQRPAVADLGWGLGLFVVLSLAFGVMAQSVWVQWWLIPPRLVRWPILALACLPWFLTAGSVQLGASAAARAAWWLAQSAAMIGGLLVTLKLVPSLGVLVLLMPLLPIILGILAIGGAAFERTAAARTGRATAWIYGIGGAMFFGWVLAAVFPLA